MGQGVLPSATACRVQNGPRFSAHASVRACRPAFTHACPPLTSAAATKAGNIVAPAGRARRNQTYWSTDTGGARSCAGGAGGSLLLSSCARQARRRWGAAAGTRGGCRNGATRTAPPRTSSGRAAGDGANACAASGAIIATAKAARDPEDITEQYILEYGLDDGTIVCPNYKTSAVGFPCRSRRQLPSRRRGRAGATRERPCASPSPLPAASCGAVRGGVVR